MNENAERISFAELAIDIKQRINSQSRLPKAVCFDYFDTLVFRTIAPEYSKKLAANQLSYLAGDISGKSIYEIRRELEKKLCQENFDKGGDPEFRLADLGARLYQIIAIWNGQSGFFAKEKTFVECFCNIEIAVEKQIQRPYPEMLELLRWLKQHSATTCLVSDFYIPQKYFDQLLDHHGLGDMFSECFISADYGVSKGSGRLYAKVCQKLGCVPGELWMIGDNHHADKMMAEEAGITTFLLDVSERQKFYKKWQIEHQNKDDNTLKSIADFDRVVACSQAHHFPEMGSTLFQFTFRLFNHLWGKQVRDVFFCSKEGELLKKLFELYQDKMFGGQIISSHYLVVSRKATFITSLNPLDHENFARLFQQYRDLSLEEFVLSLNFSRAQLDALKGQLECDWSIRLHDLQNHDNFKSLRNLALFQEMYEQHRTEQRHNFLIYLESFGVDYRSDGLYAVDVGWKGSIHNNIYFFLKEEVSVHGYYLGLLSPSSLTEKNLKTGILFSDSPDHTPFIHVYNNNRSLFEMMLGASHGSADGYFDEAQCSNIQDERSSTVLEWVGSEERVGVTILDLPQERKLFNEEIKPLQSIYCSMFEDLVGVLVASDCAPPNIKWFAKHHARMLFRPQKAEVDFFANLYHLENFGLFEFTAFDTREEISCLRRFQNFLELRKNPAALLETGVWQPIIFRRLGLSWIQPIDGIKRLRRVFKES